MNLPFSPQPKSWFWAVWGLVCVNAVLSLALRRSYLLTAVGDFTQCLLLLAAFGFIAGNVPRTEGRTRLFWMLLSLGCGMWLSAQVLWTFFEVYLRKEVPNPFVGDIILFLHEVPIMGALAVRPHIERDEQADRLGVVDFVLLLVWWLYLYLFLVIPWHYVSFNDQLYGKSFDVLYFAEHVVVVIAVALAWWRSKGGWRTVYGHLFGAALVYALASVTSNVAINLGKYYTGNLFDVPLLAAMAWFAGVGAVGGRTKVRTGVQPEAGTAQSAWISWTAMVARLSLPIMAGWAIYGGQAPSEVRNFRMLLTLCVMLLMGALASLKQARSDEELAQANVDLREASLSDLLTGARNRRFLTVSISADIQQVLRAYSGEADPESRRNRDMIFYLIDADHFKEINDHYGHDTGDEVLVEMARRISSAIRNSDVLIRWGGEEFLVLSRYTDRENATALAARVLAAVGGESFTVKGGHTIRRTCSIGWAAFPWFTEHPDTVRYEEVLRLADCALYEAKRIGRNQAVGMLPVGNEPVAVPPRPAEDTPDRSVTHFPVQTVVIQGPQILRADSPVTVAGSKVVPIS